MVVTFDVSKLDRSKLKLVALRPQESNIEFMVVTLDVSKLDRSKSKLVAL